VTELDSLGSPARIGTRYAIEGLLGKGGMAAVYRALDLTTGRYVALKLLSHQTSEETRRKVEALFEREFRTLAELSHPRMIEVYDYGLEQGRPYYTMELLDGSDLTQLTPLPWRDACAVLFDVCSSLALLHSRRLLHRDVSPRNVRRTPDGHAKLIDFGAMSPMGRGRQIVGTPAFAAPEVAQRLTLDARTDLYSAGATFYYALTARAPYKARTFAEAMRAWQDKPALPSKFVADVPAALDALVQSLISQEPTQRPRTAHEVMERVAGIAGLPQGEPIEVSHAYFSAPALVGREAATETLRAQIEAACSGRGSAVLIEAEPGEGRSRLLDTSVLDAQTAGARVLRADVRSSGNSELSVAQALVDQLLGDSPEWARASLPPDNPLSPLTAAGARVRLTDLGLSSAALQAALHAWFSAASQLQPLIIAVDDVHEADKASLALLATLAANVRRRALLIAATAERSALKRAAGVLAVLKAACSMVELVPLRASETEDLLRSVFGDVPNLSLVSTRIHDSAAGNPRDCLDLVQHLTSTGQLVYKHGRWALPNELAKLDLPSTAEAAFLQRLTALGTQSRHLLEAQALASHTGFTRDDYLRMDPDGESTLDRALTELVAEQMLQTDGMSYVLPRPAGATNLVARLSESEQQARHRSLAVVYESKQRDIVAAKHWLLGGEVERGLTCLLSFSKRTDDTVRAIVRSGLSPEEVAEVFERGLAVAPNGRVSPYELAEFRHWLVMLGTSAADRHYHAAAPAWFAEIARDSGLARWRELVDVSDPGERLTRALVAANEQHLATPEAERVYAPQVAIQFLVHYVAASIALGVRACDGRALASLPEVLAPFAPLSALVYAIWQNARATYEITCLCQYERARERYVDALSRLPATSASDLPTQFVRNAMMFSLGLIEARLGFGSAEAWVQQLDDQHGSAAVDALYLKRIVRLVRGDLEDAEHLRREAELLAVHENARPMLAATWGVELATHVLMEDLTGAKEVKERIEALAAQYPGWSAFALLAQGQLLRLCGEPQNALEFLERAVAASSYDSSDHTRVMLAWPSAMSALIETLTELDRCPEAVECGERALATCAELGTGIAALGISRSLALAEAKRGELAAAATRLETLIGQQRALGVEGLELGASYEARARVAIWAADPAGVQHFGQLTATEYRCGSGSPLAGRYNRLLREAERNAPGVLASLTDLLTTAEPETRFE
jgi:tetratricopeptide (TPR) repeat protein